MTLWSSVMLPASVRRGAGLDARSVGSDASLGYSGTRICEVHLPGSCRLQRQARGAPGPEGWSRKHGARTLPRSLPAPLPQGPAQAAPSSGDTRCPHVHPVPPGLHPPAHSLSEGRLCAPSSAAHEGTARAGRGLSPGFGAGLRYPLTSHLIPGRTWPQRVTAAVSPSHLRSCPVLSAPARTCPSYGHLCLDTST